MKQLIEIHLTFSTIDKYNNWEIWRSKPDSGTSRYYGRYMSSASDWYSLTGSGLEFDHATGDYVTFILCDNKGNEIARTGNNKRLYPVPFPNLYTVCQNEWDKIKHFYSPLTSNQDFTHWLYGKKPEEITCNDNWNFGDRVYGDKEEIHTFQYMSIPYSIIRQNLSHQKCDGRWYEYFVENRNTKEKVKWIGEQIIEKDTTQKKE